ncbi:hypothetical protein TRVL_09600 [Trypanosoma vivax]|nr:hypothetical protein TRVL_09600 [Trypanosoma vivax]
MIRLSTVTSPITRTTTAPVCVSRITVIAKPTRCEIGSQLSSGQPRFGYSHVASYHISMPERKFVRPPFDRLECDVEITKNTLIEEVVGSRRRLGIAKSSRDAGFCRTDIVQEGGNLFAVCHNNFCYPAEDTAQLFCTPLKGSLKVEFHSMKNQTTLHGILFSLAF